MADRLMPLLAAALLLAAPAAAAPKDEVLAVTNAFMAALDNNDPNSAEALTHPTLTIQVLSFPPEGGSRFRTMTRQQLFDNFRSAPPRKFEEKMIKPRIEITRDFAHVWAPYTLDIDGKRIHCGIDSFGWMKVDGKWLLTSFAWTADPKGCPPK
ncbi:nuclear transport factor 2 family protein [Sandarakinorhabdus rubra]|uniref:DUF4440 domain-containing protein n=1 Tax=Sandarakinorhabdus rubra TaxID=2672568 RepID=UPI0013DB3916|nr:DUF4440 domain-containing protein [Sandarakinorhabdus rubra]